MRMNDYRDFEDDEDEYEDDLFEEEVPISDEIISEMNYMRAFTFVFDHPKWTTSMLLASIAILIPLIGPLIIIGHFVVMEEKFHRTKRDDIYPIFDFSFFSDYLSRGLSIFLLSLLVGVVNFVVVIFFEVVFFVTVAIIGKGEVLIFVGIITVAMIFSALITLGFYTTALTTRAGLVENFGDVFNFKWSKDFISKMWKEILISTIVTIFVAPMILVLGMLLFCVGIYPAIVLVSYAQHHMQWQLYEVYLSRGGMRIPLRPRLRQLRRY